MINIWFGNNLLWWPIFQNCSGIFSWIDKKVKCLWEIINVYQCKIPRCNIYILEYNKQVALETILSLQVALSHKNVGDPCFRSCYDSMVTWMYVCALTAGAVLVNQITEVCECWSSASELQGCRWWGRDGRERARVGGKAGTLIVFWALT